MSAKNQREKNRRKEANQSVGKVFENAGYSAFGEKT